MKKKILYLSIAVLFSFCAMNFVNAQEENLEQMVNSTSMPTDEEIRATIQKFNFDKTQQEYLFKETKKRLEEMYAEKKLPETNNSENVILENFGQESEKQAVEEKKYSNHEPLTRKKSSKRH